MSGIIDTVGAKSGIVGSDVYPAGHVSNVFRFNITSGTEYSVASTTPTVAQTPLSFSATSGRHYSIVSSASFWPYKDATSYTAALMRIYLYYGTVSRSQGDTTLDTQLSMNRLGGFHQSNTTAGLNTYALQTLTGNFTAASTATHYVYIVIHGHYSTTVARMISNSNGHWNTAIIEVLP